MQKAVRINEIELFYRPLDSDELVGVEMGRKAVVGGGRCWGSERSQGGKVNN
ncbi:MAG: hypothetical protein CM1200mP36_11620 [Gammaproteobacteria bacterium]|nr:MAG: hypothetical protein CM1200mP36_11620 [Gammaproteobacteria bacterium]